MKKQSMILLTEAASDPKLMMALAEVEQLTQEIETQKQKYEQEVLHLILDLFNTFRNYFTARRICPKMIHYFRVTY